MTFGPCPVGQWVPRGRPGTAHAGGHGLWWRDGLLSSTPDPEESEFIFFASSRPLGSPALLSAAYSAECQNRSRIAPAATVAAAATRHAPNGSLSRNVARSAAMTTLVSRSAATVAAGAMVSAQMTSQ